MNDLRSRNRSLAAVPDEGTVPTSTPPRVRPDSDEQIGRRMSRRQSIAERARRLEVEAGEGIESQEAIAAADDHKFQSSRPAAKGEPATAADRSGSKDLPSEDEAAGPSSRPKRRRDVSDDSEVEEDRFPWHFQFDDDEPAELQASSPLLSRAFRATIG